MRGGVMSRLTVRGATSQRDIDRLFELSNDNQFGRNEAYYKLQHYEDLEEQGLLTIINNETFKRDRLDRCTFRYCNKCDKYRHELQRYKGLEEHGKLIELPCSVGDMVYVIAPRYVECDKKYNCEDYIYLEGIKKTLI